MTSEKEIQNFIKEFEQTTWPYEDWHHKEHLVMAVWYLTELSEQDAVNKICQGIIRYNEAKNISPTVDGGYHESLTLFLIKGISAFLGRLPKKVRLLEKLAAVMLHFDDFKEIAKKYYSPDLLNSWPARHGWVEPDLRIFDDWLFDCEQAALEKG